MTTPKINHPLIAIWHASSMPYYIKEMQKKAEEDSAPRDALYHDTGRKPRKWRCLSDLPEEHGFHRTIAMHYVHKATA